ncbi:hypothetical protein [Kandleria sp.]|uniref:hypothetical protein n=1 Tax=Kandleria sp. TaxID=2774291 RepID=UPI001B5329DD|nr:hypothetical protein [Kandleria sp.]MBP3277027.1 hypothetical protein [Kandleria sp.]
MIKLDYQTNNPRWGWSGIKYSSWEKYAFCLGYLTNIQHYRNNSDSGLIDLHVEGNHIQGAWGKEGRIHYYGDLKFLKNNFPDWDANRSAGNASVTCRMNSNDYMYSLVTDYGFEIVSYNDMTTCDIFPPSHNAYNTVLNRMLAEIPRNAGDMDRIANAFAKGWGLK